MASVERNGGQLLQKCRSRRKEGGLQGAKLGCWSKENDDLMRNNFLAAPTVYCTSAKKT